MAQTKDKEILLESGTNELELLEFFIYEKGEGESRETEPQYFGVNVSKVMQVIESPNLAPPESAPHPCYLGVISLRNLAVPVLDLSVWLGMERVKTDYEVVMVTEFSQAVTGFLVSGVTEIHRLGWVEVLPPAGFLAEAGSGSIIGLVERNGHFIQLLDLESVIAELDPEAANRAIASVVRSEKTYKALVADDSATIRIMLKKLLQAANFELDIVNNGQVAMDRLHKIKQQVEDGEAQLRDFYDIVIADIEMPQKDGFSMTKDIKSDPILKDMPVILYSSIVYDEVRHKGEAVGADDQIAKPDMDKMAERAVAVIEKRWGQEA